MKQILDGDREAKTGAAILVGSYSIAAVFIGILAIAGIALTLMDYINLGAILFGIAVAIYTLYITKFK